MQSWICCRRAATDRESAFVTPVLVACLYHHVGKST
jgi:hypothetical protein